MLSNHLALSGFLLRLMQHSRLNEEEQGAILGLTTSAVQIESAHDVLRPNQTVDHALLVADGLLARFDLMSDGARQITALHIPGDMCDLHSIVSPTSGWGITALGKSTVLRVPHGELRSIIADHPNVAMAFWRDTTLDASILAKWIANIGRKSSRNRLAHLFCEMGMRMERACLGTRNRYILHTTQEQLGDAMGLTPVHVNRTLQKLRTEGLVSMTRHQIEIDDWDHLTGVADFTPAFLLEADRSGLPN